MSTDSFARGKALISSVEPKINPPVNMKIVDAEAGLTGWLAIDSTIDGHCCGGLRMMPDISPIEMTELAKAMTLKYGFLGIPHGGAKAGILCDEAVQRERKLALSQYRSRHRSYYEIHFSY